jgi:hypothetical protein
MMISAHSAISVPPCWPALRNRQLAPLPVKLAVDGGPAMRLFHKAKQEEIWDGDIEPLGDLEAAQKIRSICQAASSSLDSKPNGHLSEPYERAAKAAMQIAMKISDDLLRDTAVRQMISLCVKAGDLKTAAILFRAVQNVTVQNEVLDENPALRR